MGGNGGYSARCSSSPRCSACRCGRSTASGCYAPGQEIVEPQFGPYLSQRYAQLVECGAFNLLVHHHVRFKLIAVLGFTMDRRVLVHCGEGTLAGMRAKQTWLYSRLSGGENLVTTDSFDEGDPSGLTRPKRVIDAELPELLRGTYRPFRRLR